MDENTLYIAIAGFMHDIGKLTDENALSISKEYLINNAQLYQPYRDGRHTHRHAVYTAAFIEHLEALLPTKLIRARLGAEDSFINLAACHHNPQTPLQWIVSIADWISSGSDRTGFDEEHDHAVAPGEFRKTRLLPVLDQLLREDGKTPSAYYYPLKEVSPLNIFPISTEKGNSIDRDRATAEYISLAQGFVGSLGKLLHREENLSLWFEHFENLTMLHASAVPAARAGKIIPDVSLYDHLKTTSALAAGLYMYHKASGTITIEAVRDFQLKKFLVATGDFYGIQRFIFNDSSEVGRNRAKILRGRSFAVSLISELAADMLCREIGIPSIAVILNAACKFTAILPNTEPARRAIAETERKINEWLFRISYGENSFGIGHIEASPQDFVHGRFINLWDDLNQKMDEKKFSKINLDRFGGAVQGYLDNFRNDLRRPLCPFCGRRPSSPLVEGSSLIGKDQSSCTVCRDHILMGKNLVRAKRVAVTTADADIHGEDKLLEPLLGKYQVAFVDGAMKEQARTGRLLKYWDVTIGPDGRLSRAVTAKFINGYVPMYREEDVHDPRLSNSSAGPGEILEGLNEGVPKTLEHIAAKALNFDEKGELRGIKALGVLKADVDQLGLLFSCGLQDGQYTLSRLATMSRQLDWFFSLYVPYLLRTESRFSDVYTVFSGGDDLLLIGPWNRLIDLAGLLHERFEEYACFNSQVHFSAGISLHKSHTPLRRIALDSEEALHRAKNAERKAEAGNERGNRVCLFQETVDWKRFIEIQKLKNKLNEWIENKTANNAMLYRLNEFIEMAGKEKRIGKLETVPLSEIECLKWRALFHYTAERNVGKGLESSERRARLDEFGRAAVWLDEYGSSLKIALWDVMYNRRKGA